MRQRGRPAGLTVGGTELLGADGSMLRALLTVLLCGLRLQQVPSWINLKGLHYLPSGGVVHVNETDWK